MDSIPYTVKCNQETGELEAIPNIAGYKIIKHSDFANGMILKEGQQLNIRDYRAKESDND